MNINRIYHVSFPGLGLSDLKINPIFLKLGSISIHWYGILIALGFTIAFLYVNAKKRIFKISSNDLYNIITVSSTCAIIFARIYYVLFFPGSYYKNYPLKIFMISEGGIAIYGAVIGGIIGVYAFCKIRKINTISVLNLLSPGLAIGQCIGRWGNFVNQEAFGTQTNLPWGMVSEKTLFKPVHPCFLYESIGCLIIFIILDRCISSKNNFLKENTFVIYLFLYGIIRAIIEGLRTDSLMLPYTSIRVSQILSVIFVIASFAYLIYKKQKYKKLTSKR